MFLRYTRVYLNEHPDAGIAYIRVSSCLYKQFIHLSLYLPEFFQGATHSKGRDNRTSQLTFQLLPGHFGDLAAFHRRGVFIEILRFFTCRKFRCVEASASIFKINSVLVIHYPGGFLS